MFWWYCTWLQEYHRKWIPIWKHLSAFDTFIDNLVRHFHLETIFSLIQAHVSKGLMTVSIAVLEFSSVYCAPMTCYFAYAFTVICEFILIYMCLCNIWEGNIPFRSLLSIVWKPYLSPYLWVSLIFTVVFDFAMSCLIILNLEVEVVVSQTVSVWWEYLYWWWSFSLDKMPK